MAGIGHNSDLTPAERKALLMGHYKQIASAKEALEEARAAYQKTRKDAKADSVVLADIDFMFRCAEVEDEKSIVSELVSRTEIADWFGLPVAFQADMFGSFDREPAVDKAARQGAKAGATGKGGNPYDESSPQGRAWAEAWSSEQKKLQEAFIAAQEKLTAQRADVVKPKRGRPPKDTSAAGKPVEGDTPDSVKVEAAPEPAKKTPPKPPIEDEELTRSEREDLSRARAQVH